MIRTWTIALGAMMGAALVVLPTGEATAGGKKHCPPGLAKKGCVPPGQQKVWKRGDYIPRDYGYRVLYWDDYGLRRPRKGEVYIETGGRVYLLAEATQRVIEAINLAGAALK